MRVLLVSHEATRTGAPRVAVEVAQALTDRGHEVTSVLRWPGPLEGDFVAASTRCRREVGRHARALLRQRFPRRRFVSRFEQLQAWWEIKRLRPDVVYANSVKSASYVGAARRLRVPVVLHVHELEPMASEVLARYDLDPAPDDVLVVACSRAVDANLRARGLARDPVVVESLVDEGRIRELAASAGPAGPRFVVAACARADERKGVDLWLEVAQAVRRRRPDLPLSFTWIGATTDEVVAQAHEMGLDDVVDFLGETDNPYAALAPATVFTHAAREDPFPLVVLEAMTLGLPAVAFDVGGLREQLGDAGVLVTPFDVQGFADAVVELLDDPAERARRSELGIERMRSRFGFDRFRSAVCDVVERVAAGGSDPLTVVRPPAGVESVARLFLLKAFDAREHLDTPGRWKLAYGIDALSASGFMLEASEAARLPPWNGGVRRRVVRRVERAGVAFLQTALAWHRIRQSDVVLAMFESQGNALAIARALGYPGTRRPQLAVIACWLAGDAEAFSPVRRALVRRAYRRVDRLFVFSSNQPAVLERTLGIPASRITVVPFGIDHHAFRPDPSVPDGGYVLAVGRDRGRDWTTLFDAVRDLDVDVKLACRDADIAGLDVPPNIERLGFVDRDTYRSLLAAASLVVVATHERAYPTGQTVALEAMAMGKCCIVTDTRPMRDYLHDDEDSVLVPEGEAGALRAAIASLLADGPRRARLGRVARQRVEESYNAEAMWARIAAQIRADLGHETRRVP